MNYSEFRSVVRSGDVIAIEGRTAISRIIRAATGQNISHVAMCVWIGNRVGGNLYLAEMREFKAFQHGRASDRLQNDMGGSRIYHCTAPDEVRLWIDANPQEFEDAAFSARNKKYGYMQLPVIFFHQFMSRLKKRRSENLVCSTYIQGVWERSGWNGTTMSDPGDFLHHSKFNTPLNLTEYYT